MPHEEILGICLGIFVILTILFIVLFGIYYQRTVNLNNCFIQNYANSKNPGFGPSFNFRQVVISNFNPVNGNNNVINATVLSSASGIPVPLGGSWNGTTILHSTTNSGAIVTARSNYMYTS